MYKYGTLKLVKVIFRKKMEEELKYGGNKLNQVAIYIYVYTYIHIYIWKCHNETSYLTIIR
jgi:hypothetical protein